MPKGAFCMKILSPYEQDVQLLLL